MEAGRSQSGGKGGGGEGESALLCDVGRDVMGRLCLLGKRCMAKGEK